MYVVKKKPLTSNIIWDAKNNKILCRFDNNGQLETNDAALVKKLKALGHEVTGEDDKLSNKQVQIGHKNRK